jgi:two-component system chemotaxis sensor kinase CheA
MSFADDEEILQDFLVEAGEILEQLSEQLVDLEQRPEDKELLNAIFRGFHTVKGGAGFLQLDAMVECCHVTENLFDILRNGQREVTSELTDVVLQALDTVNLQFEAIKQGQEIESADPELLLMLGRLVAGEDLSADIEAAEEESAPEQTAPEESQAGAPGDDITDGEFEKLVDAVSDVPEKIKAATPVETASVTVDSDSDEITDDEFENLLDQLHGKGKGPARSPAASTPSAAESAKPAAGDSDLIDDDEFEALLDQLHGKGQGPTKHDAAAPKVKASEPNEKPNEALSEKPAAALPKKVAVVKAKTAKVEPPKAAAPKKPATKPVAKAPAKSPAKDTPAPPAPAAETTVRVDTQRLDDIMNMVGELVLVRNRLVRLGDKSTDEALGKAVANLDVVTADLQTSVMKTRMQPIKKVFGRFPRVVRDLARNLKKEISLELVGEETDLDKNLVEALADPLVHLVRNSVDHGIEMPDVRVSNGKDKVGRVILAAQQEGDHILLSITDDGGGMDANKLREIAVTKGLMDNDAAQRLSDTEAFNLIFAPGFSTKTEISDVSGRGVGMDVVKTKIMQLNGSIEIESEMGKGTKILIKVPLTLAIMPTLMIMLGSQAFALPLVSVNEIFHMNLEKINIVDGQECVSIRDQAVPLFFLKNWLVNGSANQEKPSEAHVVIVTVGTQRVGFVVDQLVGQEEVVIKPLGKMLNGTPGMAGATITGDGNIALILDVPSMLQRYATNNL